MEVISCDKSHEDDSQLHSFDISASQESSCANVIALESEFEACINKIYSPIYEKLRNESFADFLQFEKQMWEAKQKCLDEAPGCESRCDKIYSHYLKLLNENAPNFLNCIDLQPVDSNTEGSCVSMLNEISQQRSKIEVLEQTLNNKELENQQILGQRQDMVKIFELKEAELKEQIQFVTDKLESEQDRVSDLERQIEEFKQTVEWETGKRRQAENELGNNMVNSDQVILQLNKRIEQLEEDNKFKNEKDSDEYLDKLKQINNDLTSKLHETLEELKLSKLEFEKELAVKEQKLSFYETKLFEAKSQQQQSENLYENLMNAFENGDCCGRAKKLNDSVEEMIHEQRNQANEEIKALKSEYETAKANFSQQIEILDQRNNTLELDLKIKSSEFLKEIEQLKIQNDELLTEKENYISSAKNSESQHLELIENLKRHYREKIESLENDINQKEKFLQQNIEEVQQCKESDLADLKQYYEEEKERLEARLALERKSNKQKLEQIQEEHEIQFKEEQEEHEDEIEMMQEQIKQLEIELGEGRKSIEQEFNLNRQKIEHLQGSLKDAKDSLSQYQRSSSSMLDQQLVKFSDERQNLHDKIDNLISEISNRDRQITIYENKNEAMLDQVRHLEEQIENVKQDSLLDCDQLKKRMINLNQEIDSLRDTNQTLKDDIIKQQLDFTRKEAIINQKIEYKESKINEMSQAKSEIINQYEERIKNLKSELTDDLHEKVKQLEIENRKLEDRLNDKRNDSKNLESEIHKLRAEKDRASIIFDTKINGLELSNKKLIEKYEKESQDMRDDYESKLESLDVEIQELDKENNDLKARLLDSERDITEISSNYERDKALWEDRFDFLENQKQQAKRDLQDAHKKFEMTVEQLRRKDSSDRGKTENAQILLITSIEKKYKDQIKDIAESHQSIVNELNEKCKQLEKDYKEIAHKYELENRGKISDYDNMKHKIKDLLDNDKKLRNEIKSLKYERDQKLLEHQAILEREKDIYKQHIEEIERKAKASESKRSELIFMLEKERANWSLDKDKLINQIENLSEQISKTRKKKDTLVKENEKLKNNVRSQKSIITTYTNGVLSSKRNHFERININKDKPLTEAGFNTKNTYSSPREMKFISDYISSRAAKTKQSKDRY